MIERVISGGQIGADIAGLRAAKKAGIRTGGYAAQGFKTLRGPNLDLRDVYGLTDTGAGYAYRTEMNVKDSDGTIRFAYNFQSPGERCTMKAILKYGMPHFDVKLYSAAGVWLVDEQLMLPHFARTWVISNNIRELNVAGNGDTAIEEFVENYLAKLF